MSRRSVAIWLTLLAMACVSAGCVGALSGTSSTPVPYMPLMVDVPDCASVPRTPLPTRQLVIDDGKRQVGATVEVASTDALRATGLMCRAEVPAGTGMAFLWDAPVGAGFWMYNTYVPLDLVYVDSDGHAVAFTTMFPCPRDDGEPDAAWSSRCSEASVSYRPGAAFTMAVELPAGWLASVGVAPSPGGDWLFTLR